ncbi:tetratricopeptide repeat protein [Horticoccus sp. 23ND18S-11]|uniref:tetratricopeptide repeat protein n=1 Tax=Horticoccus sp. 23ND18S-11 TaxID=3391832 RepID=UPI0039C917F0
MRSAPARRVPAVLSLFLFAFGLLTGLARADLVWSAQTGWRVEGGALSGLAGAEGSKALDQMNKARTAEEEGSGRSAIRTYQAIAKKYPNSIYAPEALYRSARIRLARKEYNKSFEDFQQVLARYPNTRRFNEITGEQYRIASALLDGARGRMLFGLLPGFKQREKSIEYFETILVNAPYSDYAPLSLMNVARGHQKLGNTENAIDALDRMINTYSQTLLAPDAYLKLAQTHASLVDGPYYDQGSTKEAITYFTDFMLLFPSDTGVANAEKGLDGMKTMLAESKMRMADFYFYKRSNFKAARVFYNEAITAYPESKIAQRAKARLAEVEAKAANQPAPAAPGEAQPAKKKRFFFF